MTKLRSIIPALAAATVIAVGAPLSFGTLSKVTASADVPVQLTTNSTEVVSVTFIGALAPRTNNTGTVWVQVANTTNAVGFPLATGQTLIIDADGVFSPINLTNFWIEAETAGDGVQVVYIRRT